MAFADQFISGYQAGQSLKIQQAEERRRQQQEKFDLEDREIEKQLLQRRLKDLKLQERINARQAAMQNFQMMEGRPQADMTPEMTEGGVLPARAGLPGMQDTMQTRMAQMQIPGIPGELLGGAEIPDISLQPQTMEELMRQEAMRRQMEAFTTPYTLSAPQGGRSERMVGDQVLGSVEGDPRMVTRTTRDPQGVTATERMTEAEDLARGPAIQHPLPLRSSMLSTGEDLEEIVGAVARGDRSADLSGYRGADRVVIDAGLARSGFNQRQAIADERAIRAHYQTLNSVPSLETRVAADIALDSLDEVETLSEQWNASGFGFLNSARLALAQRGLLGDEQRDLATNLTAAIENAHEAIAELRSGGTPATNRALDEALTLFGPSFSAARMATLIPRIRANVTYRVNALRNAEAVLPSGSVAPTAGAPTAGGMGSGEFNYNMETGEFEPR